MLIANNLRKEYIQREKNGWLKKKKTIKVAVDDISLEIKPNQIVGLLGINGSGKTTTIKMLTNMITPTSGRIFIDNQEINKNNRHFKNQISLISGGEKGLYYRLTGRENLEYFGSLYGLSGNLLNERVNACLKIVSLTDNADYKVESYSKGMKQRLQIARGLINDPKYLFLDEPTLGLDIIVAKEMRDYVKKLVNETNKSLLLTTHYIYEAEELCDYIYIINKGKLIRQGTAQEIKLSSNAKFNIGFVVKEVNQDFLNHLRNKKSIERVITNSSENTIEIISNVNVMNEIINDGKVYDIEFLGFSTSEPTLEESLEKILTDGSN